MKEVKYKNSALWLDDDEVSLTCRDGGCCGQSLTRDEAIQAARAILKHFNAGLEE